MHPKVRKSSPSSKTFLSVQEATGRLGGKNLANHFAGVLALASTSISISTSGPFAFGSSSIKLSRVIPKSPRYTAAVAWNEARAGCPAGRLGNNPLNRNVNGTSVVPLRMVSEPSITHASSALLRIPRPR